MNENIFKIIIIIIFIIFLIQKSQNDTFNGKIRKKEINKALEILNRKIKRKNEYVIPEEIEKKLYKNNFDKASILMLVANIMKHLGYPNAMPGIRINHISNDKDLKPGYCETYPGGQANITINILQDYDINIIAAIIMHECMHHYLNIKKIKFEDRIENEILTDTTAIYCGFGEYMYRGYKTRAKKYKYENKLQKVGYLTQKEIRYILNQL